MRTDALSRGLATFFAIILVSTLLATPALAGSSVTVTGEVIPPVPPFAAFTADPRSGTAPLTVQFSDLSTGTITGWAWDFDNDGTVDSTLQNPTFTYNTPGNYMVRLTVTGPGGSDSEVKPYYIMVRRLVHPPIAMFTQDNYIGSAPLNVQFTDQSLYSPISWEWSYSKDGGSWIQFSTEQNPRHTFTDRGVYLTRLKASNDGGSSTAYGVVIVLRNWWW